MLGISMRDCVSTSGAVLLLLMLVLSMCAVVLAWFAVKSDDMSDVDGPHKSTGACVITCDWATSRLDTNSQSKLANAPTDIEPIELDDDDDDDANVNEFQITRSTRQLIS